MAKTPKKKTPATKAPASKKGVTNSVAKRSAPRKAGAASGGAAAKPHKPASDTMSAPQRIDEKIASLKDWRGERLAEIRRLIHEVDPEVVEEWKWMGTPVWSNNGMYANANPLKDKVKITFHHGAQLDDPDGVFNNGFNGNKWRAIDLYEGDKLNQSAFKKLLRKAIDYNTSHNVPKSKGSNAALLRTAKRSG